MLAEMKEGFYVWREASCWSGISEVLLFCNRVDVVRKVAMGLGLDWKEENLKECMDEWCNDWLSSLTHVTSTMVDHTSKLVQVNF